MPLPRALAIPLPPQGVPPGVSLPLRAASRAMPPSCVGRCKHRVQGRPLHVQANPSLLSPSEKCRVLGPTPDSLHQNPAGPRHLCLTSLSSTFRVTLKQGVHIREAWVRRS